MRLICAIFLFVILLRALKGLGVLANSDESCHMSQQTDEECGMYAHRIIKPMMAYFEQINQKIENNEAEIEKKNYKIRQLEEKVKEMESKNEQIHKLEKEVASCVSKDKIIKLLEDKDDATADHIKSLKHEIQLITKSVESPADNAIKCEAELKNQREINNANENKIRKLETDLKTFADKSKEITKLKVHNVTTSNGFTFEVLRNSDIVPSDWTIIQQRISGEVDFSRNWIEYKNGFGNFWDGDFFLGLEKIHRLTSEQPHELYIHMKDFNGKNTFARYDKFAISGEDDQYRLQKLGIFSGNTTDELSQSWDEIFLTNSKEGEVYCAANGAGGWWRYSCGFSALNGIYNLNHHNDEVESDDHLSWNGLNPLKEVRMMIRQFDERQLKSLENKKKAEHSLAKYCVGVHGLTHSNDHTFEVLCNSDIAGPGWTIIQQRIRGGVDFYRNWSEYKEGFGDFWDGDFFLGLEKVHRLTSEQPHELYIHMEFFNGTTIFARYDHFALSSEDDQYRLIRLGKYSASKHVNNQLRSYWYMQFSTYDHDNDDSGMNCAEIRHNAGWNDKCYTYSSNLFGIYRKSEMEDDGSVYWQLHISLKQVKMMIRPKLLSN